MSSPNEHTQHRYSVTTTGFWLYLMTDCVLFATLFATFAVLRNNTYTGPNSAEIISIPYVLIETIVLLTSSYACGLMLLAVKEGKLSVAKRWLYLTFLLGAVFITMEIVEFRNLVNEGHSWQQSAFLSSFFTLVGTHGLHILVGLLWIGFLAAYFKKRGITEDSKRKAQLFSMYWHFLDIVWICIFTIVYLRGVM